MRLFRKKYIKSHKQEVLQAEPESREIQNKFESEYSANFPQLSQIDNLEELAMLANEIYTGCNYGSMPQSWLYWNCYNLNPYPSRFNLLEFNGGFMVKIVNGDPVAWAITIRGTVPNLGNVFDDINIMIEKVPLQMQVASDYVMGQIEKIRKSDLAMYAQTIDKVPIYIVGHSLGAVIASNIFASMGDSQNGRIQCITFDNPGSLNIARNYLQKIGKSDSALYKLAPYVYNIQSDVNIINTCNEQWGNIYRLKRWNFNYGESARALTPINSNFLLNYHYLNTYTLRDQHPILSILQSIKMRTPYLTDSSPAGFSHGYKAYLDGEKRRDYWLGYFKYCWDNDKDARDTYKDFKIFCDRMFYDLKKVQNNEYALKSSLQISSALPREKPIQLFTWLDSALEYSGLMLNHALESMIGLLTNYAQEVVRECPSYFPPSQSQYWCNRNNGLMFPVAKNIHNNTAQITCETSVPVQAITGFHCN